MLHLFLRAIFTFWGMPGLAIGAAILATIGGAGIHMMADRRGRAR